MACLDPLWPLTRDTSYFAEIALKSYLNIGIDSVLESPRTCRTVS